MSTATKIVASGIFEGQTSKVEWTADFGFKPTGNEALDRAVYLASMDSVSIGGTFYPDRDTPVWAMAVLCGVFDDAPEISANGDIPQIPYEAGEDAIY